jgi:hypothetical protein
MTKESKTDTLPANQTARWRKGRLVVAALLAVYLVVAYLLMPAWWKEYVHHHPAIADAPRITHTANGIPGDPLNVALVGSLEQVDAVIAAAKWTPAAKLGLESDLKIAVDTVLDRPDVNAPVSSLFLFGRKEDLAFEKPVGDSPRKRNHVRFWKTKELDAEGRPLWIGAATYDERVGLSHTTGQVTHHVAPDVDAERDRLLADLEESGDLSQKYYVDNFHTVRDGKNGGGDPWHTDGRLAVGVIRPTVPGSK